MTFALLVAFLVTGGAGVLRPAAATPPALRDGGPLGLSVRILAVPQVGGGGAPPPSSGTQHQAALSWTPAVQPAGVTVVGTNVYRGTITGGPYGKVNTTPVTGTTYTDLGVTGGPVRYVVTSVSSTGNESAWSNEASGTVPANPNPHTGLAVTAQ